MEPNRVDYAAVMEKIREDVQEALRTTGTPGLSTSFLVVAGYYDASDGSEVSGVMTLSPPGQSYVVDLGLCTAASNQMAARQIAAYIPLPGGADDSE